MCGRFNVSDDPLVQGLLDELGIPLRIVPGRGSRPSFSGCGVIICCYSDPFCFFDFLDTMPG